jgi:hypothetical protein
MINKSNLHIYKMICLKFKKKRLSKRQGAIPFRLFSTPNKYGLTTAVKTNRINGLKVA